MIYRVPAGTLHSGAGVLVGTGGSGYMEDWNVPGRKRARSPIPAGCEWRLVRVWNESPDPASWEKSRAHLGHYAIELELIVGDVLDEQGAPRGGFYMHGYSNIDVERIAMLSPASTAVERAAAHTSSLGCIELAFAARVAAWRLGQAGETLRTAL